jgi:MFS family permease
MTESNAPAAKPRIPRNLLAVSLGSLFTDISSEMIVYLLPLFLTNVLGAKTAIVGLIEGVAESTASLTRLFSGWLSDKLGKRKALTVAGYSLSAVAKPLYLLANSWPVVLILRFADRLGKGIRTAPRDALVADSIKAENRGFAFGLHRAADTLGATIGLARFTRSSGSASFPPFWASSASSCSRATCRRRRSRPPRRARRIPRSRPPGDGSVPG